MPNATAAHRRGLPTLLSLAIAMAVSTPFALQAAEPAETHISLYRFDIPGQPLDSALVAFSAITRIQVLVAGELTRDVRSAGLSGTFGQAEALNRILTGTGLRASFVDGDTVTLERATEQGGALQLGATSVTGLAAVAPDSQSYVPAEVRIGKTGQSLREIPQSVSVVTRQRIEDQGLNSLNSVLDQTTGLTWTNGTSDNSTIYSRGFAVSNIRIDGGAPMSWEGPGYVSGFNNTDMAAYEQIEVLRGADGLFAGGGEPGGVINLVHKRPKAEPGLSVTTSAGSWQNYRLELDATGPLAFEGALRGRMVAVQQQRDFYYDDADSKKYMLYGVLQGDLNATGVLTVGASSEHRDDTPFRQGLMRYSNGDDLKLSRETSFVADWNTHEVDEKQVFADYEQGLGADWTLNAKATYLDRSRFTKAGFVTGAIDPVSGAGANWSMTEVDNESRQLALDVNLLGNIEWLGRWHKLLLGVDRQDEKGRWYTYSGTPVAVNVFDFVPPQPDEPASAAYNLFVDPMERTQTGLYGAVQFQAADALRLILGGRYTDYEYDFTQDGIRGYTRTRYEDKGVFLPYGGLVYDIDSRWSAYGSVSETYVSQASRFEAPLPGSPLDPITGRNYEVGLKGELWQGRLNLALALYRIEREGEAVRDPDYPSSPAGDGGNCCWLAQGEVVSQGFDVEINGELLPGWQVFSGYTYNHNENKQADNARYSSVTPKHLLKLWSTYRLPGDWQRWKVGGGVTAQSANYVTGTARSFNASSGLYDGPATPFDFSQSGYAVWSLLGEYSLDRHWTAALNVNNLFNKTYYQTVGSSVTNNWYGEPRNVMVSLRGKF